MFLPSYFNTLISTTGMTHLNNDFDAYLLQTNQLLRSYTLRAIRSSFPLNFAKYNSHGKVLVLLSLECDAASLATWILDASSRTWNVGKPNAQWRHTSNLKEETVTSSRNFETQVPSRALLHPLETDSSSLEDRTTISSRNTGSEVPSESAPHPTKNGDVYYIVAKA